MYFISDQRWVYTCCCRITEPLVDFCQTSDRSWQQTPITRVAMQPHSFLLSWLGFTRPETCTRTGRKHSSGFFQPFVFLKESATGFTKTVHGFGALTVVSTLWRTTAFLAFSSSVLEHPGGSQQLIVHVNCKKRPVRHMLEDKKPQ